MEKLQTLIKLMQKSDHFLLYSLLASLFSVLLITAIFLVFYHDLPPRLPLFYSLPWGQSQLVAKEQFFLLPATLTLIILINTVLALNLHSLQYPLRRMLLSSLVMISLLFFITALRILLIFI